MADEFTPEASVDFEALAESGLLGGNGDGPHLQPPPAPAPEPTRPPIGAPRQSAPNGGDPFAQLEGLARDLPLMYRELGDVNAALARLQVTMLAGLGAAVLLAIVFWKLADHGHAAS
jgi:hypothetical protein